MVAAQADFESLAKRILQLHIKNTEATVAACNTKLYRNLLSAHSGWLHCPAAHDAYILYPQVPNLEH